MPASEYLGLFAGLFTTFAVIPQIMRVYKLKSAREISVLFTSALLTGVIIWNSIGAVLNGWLLFTKFRYGR